MTILLFTSLLLLVHLGQVKVYKIMGSDLDIDIQIISSSDSSRYLDVDISYINIANNKDSGSLVLVGDLSSPLCGST